MTCSLTGQASLLTSGECTLSVAESSLYSALIEHLLCAKPCSGCCGNSSGQSRQGLLSLEAYVLFPSEEEKSIQGREGRCVSLFSIQTITLNRDSKRHSFSVYSDGPGWRQCRVWVFSSVIQGLTHTVTKGSQQSWFISECPSSGKQFSMWMT